MSNLIDRQAAIDILDAFKVKIENEEEFAYSWARMRMSELPSVPPERKAGHWVEHHEPYTWMGYTHWSCSECGYGEEPENHNRTNYCPNCGAKMEVEHETDNRKE